MKEETMKKAGLVAFAIGLLALGCNRPVTKTFECTGNQTVALKKKTFTVQAGPAIDATGNCQLSCKDCNIVGEGIHAAGNATIMLTGGTIAGGGQTAMDLSGNAKVVVEGTVVSGPVNKSGNAKVTGLKTP
jgi:hypothetical protein